MNVHLGVDGGGSKTAFVLINEDGDVLAETIGATSYYFNGDLTGVESVLRDGLRAVCTQAGVSATDLTYAFFGLPGYGEASADVAQLDALPAPLLGHDRYTCDNDMVCGWAGSLAGADGINVISGTGSMAYGQRAGVGQRVGGWGELFGDEGSAYWVAVQGLNAFSRMSDRRLAPGPLHALVQERLAVVADLDAVGLILDTWGGQRSAIADLAVTVCQAAKAGDETARDILDRAAQELVSQINTVSGLLDYPSGSPVPVSYSGGMFADDLFAAGFRTVLQDQPRTYDLRKPLLSPVLGAALQAARCSGHPLSDQSIQQLSDHTE